MLRRAESGESLVELLVAVMILSVAALAILSGVEMAVKTSSIQRKQSVAGANVRNYAEAVQRYVATGAHYQCAAPHNTYSAAAVGYTVPGGYTAEQLPATEIDGSGSAVPCGPRSGSQRLTLAMTHADGRASEKLVIVVRRP